MKTKIEVLVIFLVTMSCIVHLINLRDHSFYQTLSTFLFASISMFLVLYWEVIWNAIKRNNSKKISN